MGMLNSNLKTEQILKQYILNAKRLQLILVFWRRRKRISASTDETEEMNSADSEPIKEEQETTVESLNLNEHRPRKSSLRVSSLDGNHRRGSIVQFKDVSEIIGVAELNEDSKESNSTEKNSVTLSEAELLKMNVGLPAKIRRDSLDNTVQR